MTLLLKEWMIENQRVSQMEKAHVLSEVEQLKKYCSVVKSPSLPTI